MNRIPALNLSNRSHTSQDTCLIFKGAAVMQSWICEAGSRTDLIEHLGTDLEWALVPFFPPPCTGPLYEAEPAVVTKIRKKGGGGREGIRDKGAHDVHKNVRSAHLSSLLSFSSTDVFKRCFYLKDHVTLKLRTNIDGCIWNLLLNIYQFSIIMISLSINVSRVSVKTTALCSTFALWPAEVILHKFYIKPFLREHSNAFVRNLFCDDLKTDQCFSHDCHGQMTSLGAIWQISVAFNQTSDLVV